MTTQIQKQLSIFPDLPREDPILDQDGRMNMVWQLFFDQLTLALQTNLKPEGFVIPPQPTSNINMLTNVTSSNNVIYDSTVLAFKGDIPLPSGQTWIRFAMITSFAGNPNGNVAGALYWFCWDTSGQNLYICTTAGDAASAIWTTAYSGINAMLLL